MGLARNEWAKVDCRQNRVRVGIRPAIDKGLGTNSFRSMTKARLLALRRCADRLAILWRAAV